MDKKYSSNYIEALEYHKKDQPGKIALKPTKELLTQGDLSLAYSPGVAAPCLEIQNNPENIYNYTSRGNTVAVISNGTAVLGLGNLGAGASKPVMEGKAVLFKKFADIDCFDLEVDTPDTEEFINAVKHLGYTWGGINLEDIKAPECFIIEEKLDKIMDIPVFHDDQHGTAIITGAALINATFLTKRKMSDTKIVVNGAGAAAMSCINLAISLGAKKENIILCDTRGVIYKGRTEGMNRWKEEKAIVTKHRTLSEAIKDADVFLGLSVKGSMTKDMVASMSSNPIIFAMANPDPEITPEDIKSVRGDAIIATGRSDYDNQVNNVMGFPYIFRGALDVRATTINEEMKIAAARSLADLARKPVPNEVYRAYGGQRKSFGFNYIIPVPFDPRLITHIPLAVAKAAIESGVSRIKKLDTKKYKEELESRLNPTASYMHSLFDKVTQSPLQRVIFSEGEDEEVIKAAIMMHNEHYGKPIIVGNHSKITSIIKALGEEDYLQKVLVINAESDKSLTNKYIDYLYKRLEPKGYSYKNCEVLIKSNSTIFAACVVSCNDADAIVTGFRKNYDNTINDISKVIVPKKDKKIISYSIMLKKRGNIIIADYNDFCEYSEPRNLVDSVLQISEVLKKSMGYKPRISIVNPSSFGNTFQKNSTTIHSAIKILDTMNLDFEYNGELSVALALNKNLQNLDDGPSLTDSANAIIISGMSSASISIQLLKELAGETFIGPILNGFDYPVQILPKDSSVNDILGLAVFAAIDSINRKNE